MQIATFVKKHWQLVFLILIFSFHVFFRFYDIEHRNQFTWDQVDNAWAAKNILIEHRFPLLGMVAKLNSGFSIGPLYYYMIAPFYWVFSMDPVASGVFAGITSIFTFFVIFFVTKKIFNTNVALVAVFLHTFSNYIIEFDRIQWPVNFIAPVSFLIFFALFKILLGNLRYFILLGFALGFSFHIHFTSVFYFVIIFLCIPFFPRRRTTFIYVLLGAAIFVLFLLPNIIVEITNKNSGGKLLSYIGMYYHGFHLKRVLQIMFDAFIEFQGIIQLKFFKLLELLVPPSFIFVLLKYYEVKRKQFALIYLSTLWIIVPWFAFATYSGEISNYYFSMTRPIAILMFALLLVQLLSVKNMVTKLVGIVLLLFYGASGIYIFAISQYQGLAFHRKEVDKAISQHKTINFTEGVPESYIYYIYTRNKAE